MLLVGLMEKLPRESVVSTIFRGVHAPEGWLGGVLTEWWFPGEADMGILIWVFLHPLYWAAIGTAVASVFVMVRGRRRIRI